MWLCRKRSPCTWWARTRISTSIMENRTLNRALTWSNKPLLVIYPKETKSVVCARVTCALHVPVSTLLNDQETETAYIYQQMEDENVAHIRNEVPCSLPQQGLSFAAVWRGELIASVTSVRHTKTSIAWAHTRRC